MHDTGQSFDGAVAVLLEELPKGTFPCCKLPAPVESICLGRSETDVRGRLKNVLFCGAHVQGKASGRTQTQLAMGKNVVCVFAQGPRVGDADRFKLCTDEPTA